jgi:hypothetical protein
MSESLDVGGQWTMGGWGVVTAAIKLTVTSQLPESEVGLFRRFNLKKKHCVHVTLRN